MSDGTLAGRGRRKWKRWVLVGLVALGLLVWWRVWQGGVGVGPARANIRKIAAEDNFTSSSATTSSGNRSHLAARHIVMVPRSEHALIGRVVPLLREELVKLPFVTDVTILKRGESWPAGAMLPDLLIEIDLRKIEESSSLLERKLTAKVVTSMMTDMARDPTGYRDDLSAPVVSLDWQGVLEHRSTSMGDGTGGNRYQVTGPHIAKEIGKAISKELTELNKKHGELPTLPAGFYGPFRPAEDVAALPEAKSPPTISGAGLLRHNETVWEFSDGRGPQAIFDEIEQALGPKGWKSWSRDNDKSNASLRLTHTQGGRVLTVSNVRSRSRSGIGSVIDDPPDSPEAAAANDRYSMHYTERFSREEIQAVLKSVPAGGNAELLLMFANLLTAPMRAALVAELEQRPAASAEVWLYLAQQYEKSDPEKAKADLRKAAVLTVLMQDDSTVRGGIDDLAKKLKEPKVSDEPASGALLKELGIPEVTAAVAVKRTVGLDEPVVGYATDEDGGNRLASVCVRRSSDGKSPYEVFEMIAWEHGKSYGHHGGERDAKGRFSASGGNGFNSVVIRWEVKETAEGRFEVTVKRQGVGGE